MLAACGSATGPHAAHPGATQRPGATATTNSAATAASASPVTVPANSPPGCAPGQIGPLDASFVSADDGFLLGITLKDCATNASSRVVLRKTTDGGLHWTPLPAPDAPWGGIAPDGHIPADAVTLVLFADAKDGWAYGPGLWATHDGGLTWHQVATAGYTVTSMAATDGQVIASLESCDAAEASCSGPVSVVAETTPAGRDAWTRIPGVSGGTQLTAQAGTGYALPVGTGTANGADALFTGPADGSARWVRRPIPCQPGAIALSATTANHLLLSCARLGTHPAPTYLYASADAGEHWSRIGTTLGLYDGASTVEQTADGVILVAGIYNGIALSRDGGRTWTWPTAIDDAFVTGGGAAIQADLFTNSDGYAIVGGNALWITRDAGTTWQQVTVR